MSSAHSAIKSAQNGNELKAERAQMEKDIIRPPIVV